MTANVLNGRASPNKKAPIEARFDKGDIIQTTGEWSEDYKWVEVIGGETGTVWCHTDYLNSISESYFVTRTVKGTVKIRNKPVNGKVVGYLKPGRSIEVFQEILGWGRTNKGWIDLAYVEEE